MPVWFVLNEIAKVVLTWGAEKSFMTYKADTTNNSAYLTFSQAQQTEGMVWVARETATLFSLWAMKRGWWAGQWDMLTEEQREQFAEKDEMMKDGGHDSHLMSKLFSF